MNHTSDYENLEDRRAISRERKKRPRMRQHGRSLKKPTTRTVLHIHKRVKK